MVALLDQEVSVGGEESGHEAGVILVDPPPPPPETFPPSDVLYPQSRKSDYGATFQHNPSSFSASPELSKECRGGRRLTKDNKQSILGSSRNVQDDSSDVFSLSRHTIQVQYRCIPFVAAVLRKGEEETQSTNASLELGSYQVLQISNYSGNMV